VLNIPTSRPKTSSSIVFQERNTNGQRFTIV